MISAQCFTQFLMATRDVLSSRQFFPARTKESNTCASFCANAWICTRQATDRDLEGVSAAKKVNAWKMYITDNRP